MCKTVVRCGSSIIRTQLSSTFAQRSDSPPAIRQIPNSLRHIIFSRFADRHPSSVLHTARMTACSSRSCVNAMSCDRNHYTWESPRQSMRKPPALARSTKYSVLSVFRIPMISSLNWCLPSPEFNPSVSQTSERFLTLWNIKQARCAHLLFQCPSKSATRVYSSPEMRTSESVASW